MCDESLIDNLCPPIWAVEPSSNIESRERSSGTEAEPKKLVVSSTRQICVLSVGRLSMSMTRTTSSETDESTELAVVAGRTSQFELKSTKIRSVEREKELGD